MEAKSVAMTLLLLSLVVGQIQVEAKSCCPSTTARNIYNTCRLTGASRPTCASLSGCKNIDGTCPSGWDKYTLENTGDDDTVNEYCKLGCAFSVCSTLQNSGEVVNGAVENCNDACSAICTKSSLTAVEAA